MTKTKITRADIISTLLTLCSVLPGIFTYSQLPDRIATHFDLNNQPDKWSSKAFAIFAIPLIMAVLHLAACLMMYSDDRLKNSEKSVNVCRSLIPAVSFTVETLLILYALGKFSNILLLALCLLSIIMIVIGNYLPKTRQNNIFGIRTPATLADETTWNRVHRFAGFAWTAGGIFTLILNFTAGQTAALIAFAAVTAGIIVYAFIPAGKNQ